MSLNENIKNAFHVVRKTYENLDKLFIYLDMESLNNGYEPAIDRFLRYSSDKDYKGWLYEKFVKLYQNKDDELLANGWRNGPFYALEINFEDSPKAIISEMKFDLDDWTSGLGVDRINYFSNPTKLEFHGDFEFSKENGYKKSKPLEGVSEEYWNFQYAIFKEIDLTEINDETGIKLIFGEFDKIRKL